MSDLFFKTIKMLIPPIIFCTLVSGMVGIKDLKLMGKVGVYAVLYFEIISTLALLLGLAIVNLLKPGVGVPFVLTANMAQSIHSVTEAGKAQSVFSYLTHIIPDSFVGAFLKGDMLQIIFIAIFFGFGLHHLGETGKTLQDIIQKISLVFFHMVNLLMKLAPLAACSAMAFTVGQFGLQSLASLGKFMATFYLACFLFIFALLGLVARIHGFRLLAYLKYIKEELLIVLSTSSSESVLPRMIAKLENLGIDKSVVGLVVPAGYSFNLDGTAIYLSLAAIFIAQVTQTPLDLYQQLSLLIIMMISSKGAAGVTGSGFIVLAATLTSFGKIPLEGLALIFAVDRFMSEARSFTNLIGNGLACIIVAIWSGNVDKAAMIYHLEHETKEEANDPELICQ